MEGIKIYYSVCGHLLSSYYVPDIGLSTESVMVDKTDCSELKSTERHMINIHKRITQRKRVTRRGHCGLFGQKVTAANTESDSHYRNVRDTLD